MTITIPDDLTDEALIAILVSRGYDRPQKQCVSFCRSELEKVAAIQRAVADDFGVVTAGMVSPARNQSIAFPRQVAMWAARKATALSYAEIGAAFGGRDHGTVVHACKVVERCMGDRSLRKRIEATINPFLIPKAA